MTFVPAPLGVAIQMWVLWIFCWLWYISDSCITSCDSQMANKSFLWYLENLWIGHPKWVYKINYNKSETDRFICNSSCLIILIQYEKMKLMVSSYKNGFSLNSFFFVWFDGFWYFQKAWELYYKTVYCRKQLKWLCQQKLNISEPYRSKELLRSTSDTFFSREKRSVASRDGRSVCGFPIDALIV